MNSAVNYYSAAQRHADAIRDARRNPPPAFDPPRAEDDGSPSVLARLARRRQLRRPLRLVFGF